MGRGGGGRGGEGEEGRGEERRGEEKGEGRDTGDSPMNRLGL